MAACRWNSGASKLTHLQPLQPKSRAGFTMAHGATKVTTLSESGKRLAETAAIRQYRPIPDRKVA